MKGSVVEFIQNGKLVWHFFYKKTSKAEEFFKHELAKLNPTEIISKSNVNGSKVVELHSDSFLVLTVL